MATPGRLLDHLAQRTTDLSAVELLVLDEADRMLGSVMHRMRDARAAIVLAMHGVSLPVELAATGNCTSHLEPVIGSYLVSAGDHGVLASLHSFRHTHTIRRYRQSCATVCARAFAVGALRHRCWNRQLRRGSFEMVSPTDTTTSCTKPSAISLCRSRQHGSFSCDGAPRTGSHKLILLPNENANS